MGLMKGVADTFVVFFYRVIGFFVSRVILEHWGQSKGSKYTADFCQHVLSLYSDPGFKPDISCHDSFSRIC